MTVRVRPAAQPSESFYSVVAQRLAERLSLRAPNIDLLKGGKVLYKNTKVTVETKDENPLFKEPARVDIYKNNRLVKRITAHVEFKRGADGKLYPCVVLRD